MSVLEVQQVTKSYGATKALGGVDLSVDAGEFVALLGANGAGKTTLLQLLTGLFAPDSGTIKVLGHDLRREAIKALSGIGVVFQQQTLDLELSVRANLRYHADLHGLPRRVASQRIEWALQQFGLTERARNRARTLSGGNRRRLELARAMLHRPHVLLMDEATVGLDPASRRDILDEIVRLKSTEQIGVLWTTHLVDEIVRADRLVVLRRGIVVYRGTKEELLKREGSTDLSATLINLMGADAPASSGPSDAKPPNPLIDETLASL